MDDEGRPRTDTEDYARRLQRKQEATWKRVLHVQAPYQWNLRRQHLGRALDVGCGIGRNLATLGPGSVGVDHNAESIAVARSRGLEAYTPEEFARSSAARPGAFDGILMAHVVEHMPLAAAEELLRAYLPHVRPGGRVFFVVPQERGYASDPTHVEFATGDSLVELARRTGLVPGRPWSFPFPRAAGRLFIYNETCLLARVPDA